MVNVSDTAANQLQSIFLEENKVPKDNYVRVGVKSGDKKSLLYLIGTTLEYSSGLNGKGFHWSNPNASRSCGCGESFSL